MSDPRVPLGGWDTPAGEPLQITLNFVVGGVSALNLLSYGPTWDAQLRRDPSDDNYINFGVDASGAASGTLVLSLTAAQTDSMVDTVLGGTVVWGFDIRVTGGAVTPQWPFRGEVAAWRPFTHA